MKEPRFGHKKSYVKKQLSFKVIRFKILINYQLNQDEIKTIIILGGSSTTAINCGPTWWRRGDSCKDSEGAASAH